MSNSQVVNYEYSLETRSNTTDKLYVTLKYILRIICTFFAYIGNEQIVLKFLFLSSTETYLFSILNTHVVYVCTIVIVLLNRNVSIHVTYRLHRRGFTLQMSFVVTSSGENPLMLASVTLHKKIIV